MSRDNILGATIGGARSYKRKSTRNWWVALVFLIVLASVIAGFHYGGQELLKVQADQRAVETVSIPISDPHSGRIRGSKDPAQDILWREFTLPSGLECVQLRQVNSSAFTYVCNYEKHNADREEVQDGT